MKILVTGSSGFIGSFLTKRLIERGDEVVGLDNINDYYDVNIKYGRLKRLGIDCSLTDYNKLISSNKFSNFSFMKLNLEDKKNLDLLFEKQSFEKVCNLAAQAGVRYSITNPEAYINSNIVGFSNILESCKNYKIKHLSYASSSSVYGLNENLPFSTKDSVDHPISLYAATKKSNELFAHTYSHLFGLPTTGLRFFTVYGPWGRPDMALFLFTKAISNDKPINVFNNGNMVRDFTYIDDIVEGIIRVIDNPPKPNLKWTGTNPDPSSSKSPYRVYNIGNNNPVKLLDFIKEIEFNLNKKAILNFMPIQPGDVPETFANVTDLIKDFNYKPQISIKFGVKQFVDWYNDFYKI